MKRPDHYAEQAQSELDASYVADGPDWQAYHIGRAQVFATLALAAATEGVTS